MSSGLHGKSFNTLSHLAGPAILSLFLNTNVFEDALPDFPVFYFKLVFDYFHELNRELSLTLLVTQMEPGLEKVCLNMKL